MKTLKDPENIYLTDRKLNLLLINDSNQHWYIFKLNFGKKTNDIQNWIAIMNSLIFEMNDFS